MAEAAAQATKATSNAGRKARAARQAPAPATAARRMLSQPGEATKRSANARALRVRGGAFPAHRRSPRRRYLPPVIAAHDGRRYPLLRSEGEPISISVRQEMEQAFGSNFEDVRFHTDSGAAAIADAIGARAFTVGRDVAFASAEYQPHTVAGMRLIAHELAHVLQQRAYGHRSDSRTGPSVIAPKGGDHERQAADAESRFAASQQDPGSAHAESRKHFEALPAATVIQRQPRSADPDVPQAEPQELEPQELELPAGAESPLTGGPSLRRERAWSQEHPEGRVDEIDPNHFTLSNFAVNSSTPTPEHVARLEQLAREWQILRMRVPPPSIRLDGHASRTGARGWNEVLAARRVKAVRDFLVAHGVEESRIEARSHGQSSPALPNFTATGMARNRRVEVQIIGRDVKATSSDVTLTGIGSKEKSKLEPASGAWAQFKLFQWDSPEPVNVAPYLGVWPGLEISIKAKASGQHPALSTGVTVDLVNMKVIPAVKVEYADKLHVAFSTDRKLSFTFGGVPLLKPELALQPDLIKPILLKFSAKDPVKIANFHNLGIDVEFEIKLRFQLGPSKGAALQAAEAAEEAELGVGATAAEIGGVVFIVAATSIYLMVLLPATMVAEAKRESDVKTERAARRVGYAWKLAERATNRAAEAVEQLIGWRGTARQAFIEGWTIAQGQVNAMTSERREALLAALRKEAHSEAAVDVAIMVLSRLGSELPDSVESILSR